MPRESAQTKLDRVRKPRVQIKYEVYKDGAMEMKELPFVVGVMGDFVGKPEKPLPKLKDREFKEIDRDNFDRILAGMSPRLVIDVDDKLSGEAEKQLNGLVLQFKSLKDFSPENVARQIAPVRKLLEQREKLKDLLARMDGNDKLQELLDEILKSSDKQEQLTRELGMNDQPSDAK